MVTTENAVDPNTPTGSQLSYDVPRTSGGESWWWPSRIDGDNLIHEKQIEHETGRSGVPAKTRPQSGHRSVIHVARSMVYKLPRVKNMYMCTI